ncbi:MAG: hypothetical protein QM667_01115 [Asticcacaulis sp.]
MRLFSVRTARIMAIAALMAALGACGASTPENAEADNYDAANFGYMRAPEVTSVAVTATGELLVTGMARPQVRVRLTGLNGQAYGVTSGADGRFQASLPQASGGSIYDLAMESEGRLLKAEGRLFVPPSTDIGAPPRSVLLRAGAASLPIWPQAGLLSVVDFDAGGAIAVAGRTQPGATVDVEIDGQSAAEARAGEDGVYVAIVPLPGGFVSRGVTIGVHSRDRFETRQIALRRPEGERIQQVGNGWYVAWQAPGNAAQTTVVF